jgi:L-rhamnose mutarotase
MIRKAFVMSVHAGKEEAYEQRHSPIWPELEAVLREHGVQSYSIFLHPETRELFAYAEIEDQERWETIAETAVCKRWWAHMKDLMPSNPDNSPASRELKEVFHINCVPNETRNSPDK